MHLQVLAIPVKEWEQLPLQRTGGGTDARDQRQQWLKEQLRQLGIVGPACVGS